MIPKFRAYHKELKMMFEVKSLVYTLRLARLTNRNDLASSRTCSFDDIILMQYTGLKDKNCVEIFEGDIVKSCGYDYCEGRVYRTTEFIGVIVYSKNSFCIKCGDVLGSWWSNDEEIEVIGNIYENPELLESVEE